MPRIRLRSLAQLARRAVLPVAVLLASCSDGPTGPTPATPGAVVIQLSRAMPLASLGDSVTVSVMVLDTKGALMTGGVPFTFSTTAGGVVEPLGNGLFRAAGNGTTSVIVTLDEAVRQRINGSTQLVRLADTVAVQVQQAATQLTVAAFDSLFWSLGTGRTAGAVLADARGNPVPGTIARVQWTTADAAVATVDSTGRVTAVSDGATSITASFAALTGSVPVRVSAQVPVSRCVQFSVAGAAQQACAAVALTVREPATP